MAVRIKPIIFSGPMVRALLDGRKSQTRRVLKHQPHFAAEGACPDGRGRWKYFGDDHDELFCVPYVIGDLLWVREAWRAHCQWDQSPPALIGAGEAVQYAADEPLSPWDSVGRSPIHMPRWASRLTLRVVDVRVQRARDISEADALAEGIEVGTATGEPLYHAGIGRKDTDWSTDPVDAFADLWDTLNAQRGFGWDANPWVCAVSFDVLRCNVSDLLKNTEG